MRSFAIILAIMIFYDCFFFDLKIAIIAILLNTNDLDLYFLKYPLRPRGCHIKIEIIIAIMFKINAIIDR